MSIYSLGVTYITESVSTTSTYTGALGSFRDTGTGVEGFYTIEEDTLVFCIKASNETIDWITDLVFFPSKFYPYATKSPTKIKVHKGFAQGYLAIRDQVFAIVKKNYTVTNIAIIGYSMGGGVAPIMALDLEYNFGVGTPSNLNIEALYSGPKVFNRAGKISFNKRMGNRAKCFKYGNDLVTKLPGIFGFYRVGEYHHLGVKEYLLKMSIADHANGYSAIATACKSLAS